MGSTTPESCDSPVSSGSFRMAKQKGGFVADLLSARWVVNPGRSIFLPMPFPYLTLFAVSSFKLLMIPVLLYINWELLAPYIAPQLSNPAAPLLLISYRIPDSSPDDPRYAKGYLDLAFLAFHIVFYSFVRQFVTIVICHPIARYFGIKKAAKLDRFGEQGYALLYFAVMGAWGYVSSLIILHYTFFEPGLSASWVNFQHGGIVRNIFGLVHNFLANMFLFDSLSRLPSLADETRT